MRFFVNVASFGMSTEVLSRTASGESRSGFPLLRRASFRQQLLTAAATVQTTLAASPIEVHVQLERAA